jgi:hypothetical protein
MGPYGTDIDAELNLTSISSYWSLVASTFYSALPFFFFFFFGSPLNKFLDSNTREMTCTSYFVLSFFLHLRSFSVLGLLLSTFLVNSSLFSFLH